VALLLAAVGVFYIATIREGNFWADDYALYIHHAENIVQGRPYAATGYLYNPDLPEYSPRAYPPVFPLLLAPVYWTYGLNFHAMKIEGVLFFILSIVAITAYHSHDLKWPYLFPFIGILGFNPNFWLLKDSVLADIPFLLFFYVTALVAAHAPREGRRWLEWSVATGILLYLCVGTRTIGFTVALGLFIYEFVKYRKLTRFVVVASVIGLLLLLSQGLILGTGEQSYADQLHPTVKTMLTNAHEYASAFMALWVQPWGRLASRVLFGVTTGLSFVGMHKHLEKGLTTLEAFLVPYVLVVWLWPSTQGLRFLLPLIPFYIFLMLLGIEEVVRFAGGSKLKIFAAIPVFAIVLAYTAFFRSANYGPIRQTDGLPSFIELCNFINANTSPGDVFVFRRSRALSLFTARPAGVYSLNGPENLSNDVDRFHAAYVVTSSIFEEDREVLIPYVKTDSPHLEKVYQNSDFQVFRIDRESTGTTGRVGDTPSAASR